jgi:hypothetical protein
MLHRTQFLARSASMETTAIIDTTLTYHGDKPEYNSDGNDHEPPPALRVCLVRLEELVEASWRLVSMEDVAL